MTSSAPLVSERPAPSAPGRSHPFARLVGATLLCVAVTALVYVLSVHTTWGQQVGNNALLGRHQVGRDGARAGLRLLDTISLTSLGVAGLSLMALAALRGRWRLAAGVAVLIAGANVTTQVLKRYILDRPDLLSGPAEYFHNSLPSGHATVAASLALALLLVVPRGLRVVALVGGGIYAGAVGVATLATGWHRAGDVVAAWGVAGAFAFAVAAALTLAAPGPMPPSPPVAERESAQRLATRLGTAAAWLLGLWALGLAVALVLRHSTIDRVRNGVAFWSGCLWIVGSLLALLALLVWAIRDVRLDAPTESGTDVDGHVTPVLDPTAEPKPANT